MNRDEAGFTLIEMIISVAIIGIIAVILLSALGMAYKSDIIADKLTKADSLARSQVEFVKGQTYSPNPWQYTVTTSSRVSTSQPSWWAEVTLLSSEYSGFSVTVSALNFDSNGDGVIEVPGKDEGVRKIVASIYQSGNATPLLVIEDYKVNR